METLLPQELTHRKPNTRVVLHLVRVVEPIHNELLDQQMIAAAHVAQRLDVWVLVKQAQAVWSQVATGMQSRQTELARLGVWELLTDHLDQIGVEVDQFGGGFVVWLRVGVIFQQIVEVIIAWEF